MSPPGTQRERAPEAHGGRPGGGPVLWVLGTAQDGGVPQAGSERPAWLPEGERRFATSLAIVDPEDGTRYLFEASPDFREQLALLAELAPPSTTRPARLPLDGIFLTHAHMGHYTGLAHLGFEALGAVGVPVYAMPRMAKYLRMNGPWSQLVSFRNIELRLLAHDTPVSLSDRLRVTPLLVPHRQEFSEVVGFRIEGPHRSVLFLPDIDSWERWDAEGVRIEDQIQRVDVAYLDGTFFDDGEIPGRDMSGFPHPRIRGSMARFADLPAAEKAKVRFLHLNHTNPALDPDSDARRETLAAGFRVAETGERFEL